MTVTYETTITTTNEGGPTTSTYVTLASEGWTSVQRTVEESVVTNFMNNRKTVVTLPARTEWIQTLTPEHSTTIITSLEVPKGTQTIVTMVTETKTVDIGS